LKRWQGLVYRAHHPGWAWAPDSGEGARLLGGRFNRPGVAALYTSQRPETAWLEAQAGFAFEAQPMTRAPTGLIVPSFAIGAIQARDVNLVFWQWERDLPHLVQVIDDLGRLLRDPAPREAPPGAASQASVLLQVKARGRRGHRQ